MSRFSDRDKTSWTKELKTELKHDAQDDGKFWMLWEGAMPPFDVRERELTAERLRGVCCAEERGMREVGVALR